MDEKFENELKKHELTEMIEKAENAVAVAAATTGATGAIPIPFADMPLLIAQQVAMMATICGIFEIDIEKDGLKALAMTAIGASGASLIGKTVFTGIIKMFPGVGSVAGGAISAGTAGITTLAVGKAFIELCKANKMGKLSKEEMLSSKGAEIMKSSYRENLNK